MCGCLEDGGRLVPSLERARILLSVADMLHRSSYYCLLVSQMEIYRGLEKVVDYMTNLRSKLAEI